jgi:rare lipoprotein A
MILWLGVQLCAVPARAQLVGDQQNGLGSYYSSEYDGAETAYGEIYRSGEMVAAHKTFPYNSRVQVRNQGNGRTVVVRIIDKGPFIRGRIIELSQRAARELGMLGQRTVPVELTLLSTPDQPAAVAEADPPPLPPPSPVVVERSPLEPSEPVADPVTNSAPPAVTQSRPRRSPPPAVPARFDPGTYRITLGPTEEGRYAVQVGSFSKLERALDKVAELQARYFDDILIERATQSGGESRYKVLLGPFPDRPSAEHYTASLKSRYALEGFPVRLTPN